MTNANGIVWRMLHWTMAKRLDRAAARALLTSLADAPPLPDARRARVAAITARTR